MTDDFFNVSDGVAKGSGSYTIWITMQAVLISSGSNMGVEYSFANWRTTSSYILLLFARRLCHSMRSWGRWRLNGTCPVLALSPRNQGISIVSSASGSLNVLVMSGNSNNGLFPIKTASCTTNILAPSTTSGRTSLRYPGRFPRRRIARAAFERTNGIRRRCAK